MTSARTKHLIATLVLSLLLAASAPTAATAGSIGGTVTAEAGGPIAGVRACADPRPEHFDMVCATTDSAGRYLLSDLPGHDYFLRFSTAVDNLDYVDEYYDDVDGEHADLITLGPDQTLTLDAALAEGGSISGRVTDEADGEPVAGIVACATDSRGFQLRCIHTDPGGEFLINGLPGGSYTVEFEVWFNEVNYQRELYADDESGETHVTVVPSMTTSGVEEDVAQGAEVLGRVTDVETGAPLENLMVCAEEAGIGERHGCDWTDADGGYAIRGLPAGAYLLEFGIEFLPYVEVFRVVRQYWEEARFEAEADLITLTPPQSLTGMDARVFDLYRWPEPEMGESSTTPPPSAVAFLPSTAAESLPRKCRKGFHRKLVKGKKRCVRKHHPRRKHRR
jgi:large repetitive protein